jgi:cholesterol transport system auxiliary component
VRRGVVTALVVASTASCLSRPALVPQLFTIDPPPERVAPPSGHGCAVVVRRVSVAPPFDGRELVYRTGPHQLERDPYASLAAPPAGLLGDAVRAYFAETGFIRKAGEAGDAGAPELVMDVEVRELSGDFARPEQPAAVIAVVFEVALAGAARPRFRKLYVRRSVLTHRTADAVVTGWNGGLADLLGELERDLDSALACAVPISRPWPR